MTDEAEDRVAALRRAFDGSFARPPAPAAQATEDLLTLRVAGDPYAVRLREVSGLIAGRRIVGVPASTPHLLGLAGIRGELVPVFGLASILGHAQAASPRWMILCGTEERVALAFADFEGHARVPGAHIHRDDQPGATRRHVTELVRTDAGVRPILSIPLVLSTLRDRGHARPPGEP